MCLRVGAKLQLLIGERKISPRQPPGDKLRFLAETVLAEVPLLCITDGRLFAAPMDADRAASLRRDIDPAQNRHRSVVDIDVQLRRPSARIHLHAKNLTVQAGLGRSWRAPAGCQGEAA